MKVQEVLTLHLPILDCGCVDIESVYPEFIRELKAAGVDTILEEKQLQFAEWKENVSE